MQVEGRQVSSRIKKEHASEAGPRKLVDFPLKLQRFEGKSFYLGKNFTGKQKKHQTICGESAGTSTYGQAEKASKGTISGCLH